MSKVIKKFRKNVDYDEFSSKRSYDSEQRKKKLESKQKTKQKRGNQSFPELGNDGYDDFSYRNMYYD